VDKELVQPNTNSQNSIHFNDVTLLRNECIVMVKPRFPKMLATCFASKSRCYSMSQHRGCTEKKHHIGFSLSFWQGDSNFLTGKMMDTKLSSITFRRLEIVSNLFIYVCAWDISYLFFRCNMDNFIMCLAF